MHYLGAPSAHLPLSGRSRRFESRSQLVKRLNKTEGLTTGLPLGLPDAARTVQVHDGKVQVKNGPYLAEGAGGYSVHEAESMEAAIALAARIPAARLGGAVEIRPAETYW
jgi:hypothetical protein